MPHVHKPFQLPTMDRYQQSMWKDLMKNQFPQMQGQMDISQNPLFQQGQTYYQGLMQPGSEAYQNFAAPEMRQFNEQIMPGIAEQFAGVGGLSSSGFQQQAAQAGTGLAERLAALRSGLQMQGAQGALQYAQAPQQNVMQLLSMLLGKEPFAYMERPQKPPGFWRSLLPGVLGGAAQGAGAAGMMAALA